MLSDPVEKAMFDDELRRSMTGSDGGGGGGGTFWTICPYCYHVYEYDRVYEDCCLRCANERCRRVLHAVAMGAPPPPDVVEKGQYWCPGFMPLEIRDNKGEKLWVPFERFDHDCCGNGEGLVVDEENVGTENGEIMVEEMMGLQGECNESLLVENEVGKKRRKSVAWNSRKVMGRGIRVDSLTNEGYYHRNVDQNGSDIESGVEFFEGDDDVFVACKW